MIEIKSLASGSSGNAYFLGGETPLLLECGINFKELQQRLNFSISALNGCLISHFHADHSKAAKDLMKTGIDVYTSQGTADTLKLQGHRLHIIKAKKQFSIGNWIILPFDTVHNVPEPLGFLLANGDEKILFATDTCYLKYRFKGLTHILIECNYSRDILDQNRNDGFSLKLKNYIIKNHMSLKTVKEFLLANDLRSVQEIHLLHLSDKNSDADRFREAVQGLTGKEVYVAQK